MAAATPAAVRKQISQSKLDPVYLVVGDDEQEVRPPSGRRSRRLVMERGRGWHRDSQRANRQARRKQRQAAPDHAVAFFRASRVSACTASTIDLRPRPLPIEMFCRNTRSTMPGSRARTSSAGWPV